MANENGALALAILGLGKSGGGGGTTYEAGEGITINDDDVISVDDETVALKEDLVAIEAEIAEKQDTITDLDTIRSGAALGATALQEVPTGYATETYVDTAVADKQDTLTAGENITIENNVISATGGGSSVSIDNQTIVQDPDTGVIKVAERGSGWTETVNHDNITFTEFGDQSGDYFEVSEPELVSDLLENVDQDTSYTFTINYTNIISGEPIERSFTMESGAPVDDNGWNTDLAVKAPWEYDSSLWLSVAAVRSTGKLIISCSDARYSQVTSFSINISYSETVEHTIASKYMSDAVVLRGGSQNIPGRKTFGGAGEGCFLENNGDGFACGWASSASGAGATIRNKSDGAAAIGYVKGPNGLIESDGAGSYAQGYVEYGKIHTNTQGGHASGWAGTGSEIFNYSRGAFVNGYAAGLGSHVESIGNAYGSFVNGYVESGGTVRTTSGSGSIAAGFASNYGLVQAGQQGAVAMGRASGSMAEVRANSQGSTAMGYAVNGAVIKASGQGAFSLGTTMDSGLINADSQGSFAGGKANGSGSTIQNLSSSNGSFAYGQSVNGYKVGNYYSAGAITVGEAVHSDHKAQNANHAAVFGSDNIANAANQVLMGYATDVTNTPAFAIGNGYWNENSQQLIRSNLLEVTKDTNGQGVLNVSSLTDGTNTITMTNVADKTEETWTFTLDDDTTVTKTLLVK